MVKKHPDSYTDQEPSECVDRLVSDQIPESIHLDYKEEIELSAAKDRRELCKDVTSFAN